MKLTESKLKKIIREEIEESSKHVIGYLPGGFKPPHSAHFTLAKTAIENCDELHILVGSSKNSTRVATGKDGEVSITPEISQKIWDIYTKYLPNVSIETSQVPGRDIYEKVTELGELPNASDIVVKIFVGTQGNDAVKYNGIIRHGNSVGIHKMLAQPIPSPDKPTGTQMRNHIANGDKVEFFAGLPNELSKEEKEKVWNICRSNLNESREKGQLLKEGGLGGHMAHFYENLSFTFEDLKNIVNDISSGNLEKVVEKTDGQNLWVSWNNGVVVTARNKGDLRRGGMNFEDLAEKFKGRGALYDGFTNAYKALDKAFKMMHNEELQKVFGNANNWISIEVIYPEATNVIGYDKNTIILHNMVLFDDDGVPLEDDIVYPDIHPLLEELIEKLGVVQKNLADGDWDVKGDVIQKINQAVDSEEIQKLHKQIDRVVEQFDLTPQSTIGEYLTEYFDQVIVKSGINIDDENARGRMLDRIVTGNNSAIGANELKKMFAGDDEAIGKIKRLLNPVFINNSKKTALKQIMSVFIDVGEMVLKNIESGLISLPDEEAKRIGKMVADEERKIRGTNDEAKIKALEDALYFIKGRVMEKAIEGLVIKWKGNTYKITGLFAPINQLLGILRYG